MTGPPLTVQADVAVIGAGPAGLTAAIGLRRLGVGVVVLEREAEAGGIPRITHHTGYGLRDLHRMMTGPAYAERLVQGAVDAGADLRIGAMVTDWSGDRSVMVTSPEGRWRLSAQAIVLATGARERPRSARLVPGDRPAGVLTTGMLQDVVHGGRAVSGGSIGSRAVVVGAELVSWSAVLTLREAGCRAVLMTTEHERIEAPAALVWAGRSVPGLPVSRRTRVTRIMGRHRVEAVELTRLDTGQTRTFACDTVIFTGDWIPDSELARAGGLDMDPGHRGPVVDGALRTSAHGVFGAGNLLHPVDTADVAALDGRHVAGQVARFLEGGTGPQAATRVLPGAGFAWVSPGLLRPADPPPRERLLLWATEHRSAPRVVVRQGDRVLRRRLVPWPASPGRVFRLPWSVLAGVHPEAGDVTIGLG
ncbi:MAG: FAD-dependent oxidoreductase [Actinobacteria bacterium]|nr:FAD-dependent oxidoreductase [Actinomycetota bacterium]